MNSGGSGGYGRCGFGGAGVSDVRTFWNFGEFESDGIYDIGRFGRRRVRVLRN
jgi:hypothetical protein